MNFVNNSKFIVNVIYETYMNKKENLCIDIQVPKIMKEMATRGFGFAKQPFCTAFMLRILRDTSLSADSPKSGCLRVAYINSNCPCFPHAPRICSWRASKVKFAKDSALLKTCPPSHALRNLVKGMETHCAPIIC